MEDICCGSHRKLIQEARMKQRIWEKAVAIIQVKMELSWPGPGPVKGQEVVML